MIWTPARVPSVGFYPLANAFETMLRFRFRNLKIDSMSNVDRVMRLPGTVNYPKAEKRSKGQVEALAHIAADYGRRFTFPELRSLVPGIIAPPPPQVKKAYAHLRELSGLPIRRHWPVASFFVTRAPPIQMTGT
jgi:hypothetical protein